MLLRQSEVEKVYRISKTTLHRWLKDGKLTDHRTVGGHRRYDSAEIEALLSISDGITVSEKDVALYARVSTQKQAENLAKDTQIKRLEEQVAALSAKLKGAGMDTEPIQGGPVEEELPF